ncbi:MAG: hypothetical protein PSN34_15560 [Urechidicola sp.]|nr:hypothetical protein [Urechidicola sp.]
MKNSITLITLILLVSCTNKEFTKKDKEIIESNSENHVFMKFYPFMTDNLFLKLKEHELNSGKLKKNDKGIIYNFANIDFLIINNTTNIELLYENQEECTVLSSRKRINRLNDLIQEKYDFITLNENTKEYIFANQKKVVVVTEKSLFNKQKRINEWQTISIKFFTQKSYEKLTNESDINVQILKSIEKIDEKRNTENESFLNDI